MTLGESVGAVAPFYNLVLVAIVLYMFYRIYKASKTKTGKKHYLTHWKLLFAAVCIFIIEQVLTVIKFAGLIYYPSYINGIFEMCIISLFIYMLLLQKEYVAKNYK